MGKGVILFFSISITRVTQTESTPNYAQADKMRTELDLRTSQGIVLGAASALEEGKSFAQIKVLEAELKSLEQICAQEAGQLDHLVSTRKRLADVREAKWKLVTEIEASGGTSEELNQLMLIKHYLEPALEMRVKEIAAQLSVPVVIDQALVRSVLEQEKLSRVEREEILEKVKASSLTCHFQD